MGLSLVALMTEAPDGVKSKAWAEVIALVPTKLLPMNVTAALLLSISSLLLPALFHTIMLLVMFKLSLFSK